MKKITSLFLVLMMVLGMTPCLAEQNPVSLYVMDDVSLEMSLPAGYTAKVERVDTALYAAIETEELTKANFTLSIAYADLSDGPTPAELTEEDIELAKQLVGADFHNPEFSVVATDHGTKFLLINENDAESDYAIMITNYEGSFVQMYITPAEGHEVTEADVTTALQILTSVAFKLA